MRLVMISLFLCLSWQNVQAERQSLASIGLQAESFLANYPYQSPYPVEFEVSTLDQRLNLKPCNQSLKVGFSRKDKIAGNTSLLVSCPQPVNWKLHLPVRIKLYDDVIVSKKPLVRGQSVDASSVKFNKLDVSNLHQGYFRDLESLDTLQTKRNLASGSVLNSANLAPRKLVKSGQTVTIILDFNGLQIKANGKALQSASQGQMIKVRNIQSNKIIEGRVSATGQVKVSL